MIKTTEKSVKAFLEIIKRIFIRVKPNNLKLLKDFQINHRINILTT